MAIALIVGSLLLLVAQGLHRQTQGFPKHAFHVEDFKVTRLSPPPLHITGPLAKHIAVSFATTDLVFNLDLALNEHIYSRDSKIYSSEKDAEGKPIEIEKTYRSYRGNATIQVRDPQIFHSGQSQSHLISTDIATLTFYPDERAHVLVITPDDIFTLDLLEIHEQAEGMMFKGKNQGTGMSLTRLTDRNKEDITPFHKSIMDISRKSDRRNLIIYFSDCWPGQSSTFSRVASIGVIVDTKYYCKIVTGSDKETTCSFTSASNSKVLADIQSLINDASAVYSAQMRIYLRLGTIFLGSDAANLSPNPQTCGDMSTQLNVLKAWRASYYTANSNTDSNTVFHLFTNCHPPPGTVGLAYIGVLCNAASGYSTGVVNRVYDETWLTFAHEAGHNFGMTHSFQNGQGTTGGIMDYGDGIYQGEYQFEPGKKTEVCQQLTSALSTRYSGFLPVDRCLPQYNENPLTPTSQPTRKPTTNPTRKPTNKPTTANPTPRPTSPTTQAPSPTTAKPTTRSPTAPPTKKPTLRPTAKPTTAKPTQPPTKKPTFRPSSPPTKPTTAAPNPSPRPTARPTGQPTNVQYYARWYSTGIYGDCFPECGSDSYRTEIIQCCASDLSSSNKCNWQLDDSWCDPTTKPDPKTVKCSVAPCQPANLCGNGVVDTGEYCDPSIDGCCLEDCSGFIVTSACVRKNTKIDAAFTDRDGRAYLFQGPYFTRYSSFFTWYYGKPADRGYPKAIKGNFPLQQCTKDIGSIIARQSNQLYVFCNSLEYVRVDMDNQLQLIGTFNAGTEWKLPQAFIDCGQVNAGVALPYYMLLFCQNIWVSVPYTRTSSATTELQVRSVSEFGYTLQNGFIVTAILYDVNSGYWAWFQGPENYVTMQHYSVVKSAKTTRSIFNDSEITNITTLDIEGGCYQDSCINCDNGVCKGCDAGYVLYGARCFNDSVLAYLQCDEGSESDETMVEEEYATLFARDYTTGVSGDALIFNGQQRLKMKPLNRDVTDFSVSAYFYPTSLNKATFVTIDDRFYFAYEAVNDTSSFQVLVKIDDFQFSCYVATPMLLNQWNKIQVIVKDSIIWTGANGFYHMRAFDTYQEGLALKLTFESWSIGADADGINGYLDEFILMDEGTETSSDDDDSLFGLEKWQVALIGVGAGLVFLGLVSLLAYGIYKYTHRLKLKEQVHDFDANFK